METVPAAGLPPVVPLTAQMTAVLVALLTVAWNWVVCPACRAAVVGVSWMATGGVRVITALAWTLGLAALTASTDTVPPCGTVSGAV